MKLIGLFEFRLLELPKGFFKVSHGSQRFSWFFGISRNPPYNFFGTIKCFSKFSSVFDKLFIKISRKISLPTGTCFIEWPTPWVQMQIINQNQSSFGSKLHLSRASTWITAFGGVFLWELRRKFELLYPHFWGFWWLSN